MSMIGIIVNISIKIILFFVRALAIIMIEDNLADTKALRCNLNQLVFLNIFKHLFKAHNNLWYNASLFIRTRSTHVSELLCLANIDNEVVLVNMFAHHLAAINVLSRVN